MSSLFSDPPLHAAALKAYIPPPNVVDAAPRLSLPSQKAVAERPSYALGPPLDAAPDADAGDAVA